MKNQRYQVGLRFKDGCWGYTIGTGPGRYVSGLRFFRCTDALSAGRSDAATSELIDTRGKVA